LPRVIIKFMIMSNGHNKLKGFTLIELLVVVGIIGLLSTLAVVSFSGSSIKARDAKRMSDIRTLKTAIDYYINTTSSNSILLPGLDSTGKPQNWNNGNPGLGMDLKQYFASGIPSENNVTKGVYFYCTKSDNTYLIGAVLEQKIDIPGDMDGTADNYSNPWDYCLTSYPGAVSVKLSSVPNCNDSGNGSININSPAIHVTSTVFCFGKI
jgi:prepilin-type N-terminal cleavage/methylation domain-containing protein